MPGTSQSSLVLSRHRIHCLANGVCILPSYKGATFHGGFGSALKEISPYYHRRLCGALNQPNPLLLIPPLDLKTTYPPGHEFFFELTLIGNTVDYFPICRDAIVHLGKNLGFGKRKSKFDVVHIASSTINCHDKLISAEPDSCEQVTIRLQTRMRLKENDKLVRNIPTFKILFARLLGRLNSLSIFYGDGPICSRETKNTLFEKAAYIVIAASPCRWEDWSRFSSRQKQWMKFGGLTGTISFTGNLSPFMPYLKLGEWTHVGGKTSFGLGKFILEV